MSVNLSFEICQSSDCTKLTFVETTGSYNAISNTGGWGTPNEDHTDAETAVLTVLLASGNTYTIDLFDTGYFPTDNTQFEFDLTNEDFGYISGSAIDDQIINFTYTVTTATSIYTANYQQAFYCQVQCCVMSMFADIDVDCDCSKDKIDSALQAYALLKGLIYSANCGNKTYFNNILAQLNKLCLNSNCQNCK